MSLCILEKACYHLGEHMKPKSVVHLVSHSDILLCTCFVCICFAIGAQPGVSKYIQNTPVGGTKAHIFI